MWWVLLLLFLIFCVALFFLLLIRAYKNEYKLIMLFGKKGCGKTTTLNKIAIKYLKKGWPVFSTDYIQGCYHLNPNDFGYVDINPDQKQSTESSGKPNGNLLHKLFNGQHDEVKACVLIDEVGLIWHARDWKSFDKKVREYLKLQRHYHVRIYLCSQSFDVDKSIRDLCDEMWLLVNVFNIWSYGKRILKTFDIVQATAESPSSLVENLKFDHLLLAPFGSRMLTFIPKYSRFFDSFEAPALKHVDFEYWEIKDPQFRRLIGQKSDRSRSLFLARKLRRRSRR